ncbi:MAG: hypothetical protein IGR80_02690 [Synechococcales cyanobacterium K44_A2020_017]|jgi:hypothetical protein|nr:hypothetical protein [Synechococcales cyanobacterium K32_A2020_035]MBF2093649.1 hypothetical protein [Synechococcales cyanobacterium K44_A2020_017]
MSVNKYQPHILVLPEDRANSEIANGFLLNSKLNERSIQVLPFVRGWKTVVEKFTDDFVPTMRLYPARRIVLLIDFDEKENRFGYVEERIPDDLKDRVFVLGVLSEPEKLRSNLKRNFEDIGEALSRDCSNNTDVVWQHDLLNHNTDELKRMVSSVKPFLFS